MAAKKSEMVMEEAIATQRQELKKLENQRDLHVIAAKLKAYSEVDPSDRCYKEQAAFDKVSLPPIPTREIAKEQTCDGNSEHVSLVQSLLDTMVLTRLPIPESSVFSGDPFKFIEWSTNFKALIERRCLDPADRLFYLHKYISGEAQSVIEGSFYRKDDEAYNQAWKA